MLLQVADKSLIIFFHIDLLGSREQTIVLTFTDIGEHGAEQVKRGHSNIHALNRYL